MNVEKELTKGLNCMVDSRVNFSSVCISPLQLELDMSPVYPILI